MHQKKQILWNVLYMIIFAFGISGVINSPDLYLSFGFTQKSSFIGLYLFYKLYGVTVDFPIREFFFSWRTRSCEFEADKFAVSRNRG